MIPAMDTMGRDEAWVSSALLNRYRSLTKVRPKVTERKPMYSQRRMVTRIISIGRRKKVSAAIVNHKQES